MREKKTAPVARGGSHLADHIIEENRMYGQVRFISEAAPF